ncbi:DDE-type integrase/transposase/recombinase [Bradyrhizobium sp. 146]|nr:DDE-type integrase/transposase/recombinase [Bradyrhizobium sp. 146]
MPHAECYWITSRRGLQQRHQIGSVASMAGKISMGARREVVSAVMERYRSAKRAEKGRILDELCATTGWHRKHAVRALRRRATVGPGAVEAPRERKRRYGATIKDAMTALWEASDRVCGKRLMMIPTLLPALEQHGRLRLGQADRDCVLSISPATIDRLLVDVKVAASGGRRRRAGFYSAIRREVPIRTFNDWNSPPPGFCEVDMVAHGGTSVAGSFIQTLTMVDVATGWTECLPLVTREGSLVVEAINRAQTLFPWLLRGVDFDNDSAFMNDVVVPWCREQKLEVTRSRAYKKNDQAFVEQKNGGPSPDGLRPLRWHRDGSCDGPPLCGDTALRQLLPAVVQAEGEAPRRG